MITKLIQLTLYIFNNQFVSIFMNDRKSLKDSFNTNNLKNYISIDFKDQTFNCDRKESIDDTKSFEIILLTAVFAGGVIVAGLFVLVLKKMNKHNSHDNEEELNEHLNQNNL